MSLARKSGMSYAAAGAQLQQPFERMRVYNHVYVPDAEACAAYNGRGFYNAPSQTQSRKPLRLPMGLYLIVTMLAVAAIAFAYLHVTCEYAALNKKYQATMDEIRQAQRDCIILEEELARASDSNIICYEAQQLGMVSKDGMIKNEIYAPDTRPVAAASSLAAGSVVSWAGN